MKSLKQKADQFLSPVLAHYTEIEIKSGKGVYLYDFNNKPYLDFTSGIGVTSTGHCHSQIVKAIQKQAKLLIHACAGIVYYEPNINLAEKLSEILGSNLNSVFFTQSGSEAIESAIKLAKYTTKKSGILAFKGAFHGRTLGALSITTSKVKYQDGYHPLLAEMQFFPYPYCYRCPFEKKPENCNLSCLANLEAQLQTSPNIGAIIIEPILGEGGYVPLPPNFLKKLREITSKNNILLILDEIQTGFGKTGTWFAFQKEDIIPDIIALAKGIASGLPLGACVANKTLMQKWTTGAHGGTYSGNPISCSAGIATIDVLKTKINKVNKLSKITKKYLTANLQNHPFIGDIRVTGLMIGLEFVKDKISKDPYPDLVQKIREKALEKQLIIISCGLYDNVIRLIPPLTITKKELLTGLEILVKVINEFN